MYRNPENPDQQWIGRGRQPLWVKSWLEKHQSLDGIRI
ncbi:H-NS family nucleoid-associated regulatory protein [Janthinobacterium sp. GW458P]